MAKQKWELVDLVQLNRWIDCLISMAYFCLSGDGLGVIWAKIGGQWPSVAQVNVHVQQRTLGDVCSHRATQAQDTYQGFLVRELEFTRIASWKARAWHFVWLFGSPNYTFWIFTYVYAVGSDGTSLQEGVQPIRGQKRLLSTNKRVGKCHQNTDCHLGPPLTMGPGISDRQLTLRHNTEGQGRSQRMRQPLIWDLFVLKL